jgi:hypothetical protein
MGSNTGYDASLHGVGVERFFLVGDVLAAYQLDGGVMAYHGFDG